MVAHGLADLPGIDGCVVCIEGATIQIPVPGNEPVLAICPAASDSAATPFSGCADTCPFSGEGNWARLQLQTPQQGYGNVFVKERNAAIVAPYLPFAGNTANLVALHIENRRTLTKLQEINRVLDARVDERTIELRQSEENMRITLDSIGDAVIATDVEGRIVRINPVAARLTGWPLADAIGQPLNEVFHIVDAQTRHPAPNPVTQVLSTGEVVALANNMVLIGRHGSEHQIADSGAPIQSDAGETLGVVLVFRDVTEANALEEQLRQSEKMQALGQLAGGIAHDFNNLLMGIIGSAELLKLKNRYGSERRIALLDTILRASTRAADLTKKLLAFGRKGRLPLWPVNIHGIIDDTVSILHSTIDKKVRITVTNKAQNYTLIGDHSELQNALMNLVINASHAMADGGEIRIETSNAYLTEAWCDASTFDIEPGAVIKLQIQDAGCGIPPDSLQRIFEPFYTTKGHGKGTGLGLAAVYGTVQQHHGAISVSSEVGVGTSFQILLPCAGDPVDPEEADEEVIPGAGQLVLLVDDEEVVRATGRGFLEQMGYRVLMAEDGLEAVGMFQKMHAKIDLVIMDMIMPEMNGHEAFIKMKEIDSGCHVIISSGYTKNESVAELSQMGLAGFIAKPFRYAELSRILAETLGASSSG